MFMAYMCHIISHTDLDGITAAAVAWHHFRNEFPVKVSLVGYGSVDSLILENLKAQIPTIVLDLFCQKEKTIEEIDHSYDINTLPFNCPFVFDHHETTAQRYANRPWLVVDTSKCAAKVYFEWLLEHAPRTASQCLSDMVDIANDRDLWLNQREESRLWQAMITLCGPESVLTRLAASPSSHLKPFEEEAARDFIKRQEIRFEKALATINRFKDIAFVEDGILEFGDVSDFGGLILDRRDNPPLIVAVAARRALGDWVLSLRSRNAIAGSVVGILRDGKKVRGGGHDDSAALYFPPYYTQEQIRSSLEAAVRTIQERNESASLNLGNLLKDAMKLEEES
jgi:hypothetical protein